MSEQEIQGRPAPPDAEMWLDYEAELKRGAPNRYEDAAKSLAAMISLTITILFTLHEKLRLYADTPGYVFAFLGVWLAALFCAFMVMFPFTYEVSPRDVDAVKEMQSRIVQKKRQFFIWSVWLYFGSLTLMILSYAALSAS